MKQNLRRIELLDFVSRDLSEYAWSLRTPDRRLEYSGIKYTDQTVQVDEVEEALKKELEGPGKFLGHRALHKKLRQVHELNVPRDLVYAVIYNVDPDALAERVPQFKKKAKDNFTSRGQAEVTWVSFTVYIITSMQCLQYCCRYMQAHVFMQCDLCKLPSCCHVWVNPLSFLGDFFCHGY